MGRLDNKVAVVTGGASNPSLGRAMSIAFAREGAKVVLTDIDTEGGKKVEEEILNSGGEAFFIEQDVLLLKIGRKLEIKPSINIIKLMFLLITLE